MLSQNIFFLKLFFKLILNKLIYAILRTTQIEDNIFQASNDKSLASAFQASPYLQQ